MGAPAPNRLAPGHMRVHTTMRIYKRANCFSKQMEQCQMAGRLTTV
jgi:hypothetical protein